MNLRRRFGTLLILIGIGYLLFPLLQHLYGSYSQWQLEREFDAASQAQRRGEADPASMTTSPLAELSRFFSVRSVQAEPLHGPRRENRASSVLLPPQSITSTRFLHSKSSCRSGRLGLVRLEIPKIRLRAVVLENAVDWRQLAKGPAHFRNSALPGQNGNCAIAAHRNVFGCWFRHLNQLRPGDEILLRTPRQVYTYRVTKARIVATNNMMILKPTPNPTLTLVTCMVPYAKHRLVIFSEKES